MRMERLATKIGRRAKEQEKIKVRDVRVILQILADIVYEERGDLAVANTGLFQTFFQSGRRRAAQKRAYAKRIQPSVNE